MLGLHAWLWPNPSNATQFIDACVKAASLNLQGLIMQQGLDTPGLLKRGAGLYQRIAVDHGVALSFGLGMDGHNGWKDDLGKLENAIIDGLAQTQLGMLNWETQWSNDCDDKARADAVATAVLAQVPDAVSRLFDAPWCAPNFIFGADGRKINTHPFSPVAEFRRLCSTRRFVQAYGADQPGSPDGASQRMLDWARTDSQYPALGTRAHDVLPATQLYKRSVKDVLDLLLLEPHQCLWHIGGIDREAEIALRCYSALGKLNIGSVVAYQTAAHLPTTGLGPITYRALTGLNATSGVVWHR